MVKKRILFIITQAEIGGAQRFLKDLISHLNRENYELSVATGPDGQGPLTEHLKAQGWSVFLLSKLRRDIDPWNDCGAIFQIRSLIKKIKPETVFLNSSKAGFIGSLATVFPFKLQTRNYKLKTIYRIGGWTFNDPWPKWKKHLWILLEKISARWKDIIIVNNQHDLKQAQTLKIKPRQKLVLIYNGLDAYQTDLLPKEEARLKLFEQVAKYSGRVFQAKMLVGAVANFYPAKGLKYLLAAAEQLKDQPGIIFFVIGDGVERPMLEKLISEKKLANQVFLLGRLPEASRFLSAFDAFVLPSVKEGFPWSVLEAMAAKIPVIATRVGAVPEIITDRQNGLLVDPGRPAQIAAALHTLLGNDRLRQELGIQGHQTLLFKFGAEKMVREVSQLL